MRTVGISTALALGCGLVLALAGVAYAADIVGDPYAINVCPVSGEPLGTMGDPIIISYEGREIRFCCDGCEPKFNDEPAKYLAKVDQLMTEAQDKYYPLSTCVVSGKEIDANAKSVIINNRQMKFCCADCPDMAKADLAKFIAKLDEAVIAAQSETYTSKTCPVSGEALGSMGDPIAKVVGNRLVMLCCSGCEKGLAKNPAAALAALDGKKLKEGSGKKS